MISKRITVPLLCLLPLLAVMALMGALHTPTTNAAPDGTQTVTTLADSGTGSLRQAIADATAGDTIDFSVNGIIVLATELVIDKDLTINGGDVITVSGNDVTRVFKVTSGKVVFESLGIAHGNGLSAGGGMHNIGTVIISNCTFISNTSFLGAAIANNGSMTITASIISANSTPENGEGGGIYNGNGGSLVIRDSTFSNNSGDNLGGGIHNSYGTVTIYGSTFSNNIADMGGGIYNDIYGTITIYSSHFFSNTAINYGGGIYNYKVLIMNDSTVSGNSAGYRGGGINNRNTALIDNSIISNNTAADGGGISNYISLTLTKSILVNNSVDGYGGGLYDYGAAITAIDDSTISGNSAGNSGGGIYNKDGSTLDISSSTFYSNSAANAGGFFNELHSTVTINNTIITNSSGGDCKSDGGVTAAYVLLKDTGANACITDGVNNNIVGVDPQLLPLANNGGSTLTHALQPDSPALDAGANCGATDQRGIVRPQGAACDIGAYEYEVVIIYTDFVFLPVVVK